MDIPGYVALIKAGRYDDAVRLIRKDNPFPTVCALICEHPCEGHCRRDMIDAPINIRGLKMFAVDNCSEVVPTPKSMDDTGKTVAIVGGGPSGLTAAYYLALMMELRWRSSVVVSFIISTALRISVFHTKIRLS